MNNEEKILAMLEKLDSHMETLKSGQAALDKRMLRLETVQAAIDERMGRFETSLSDLQAEASALGEGQTQLQEGLHRINGRLDLDVGKRLDGIAGAQEEIGKRLDTLDSKADNAQQLAEKAVDKVDVIHAVVAHHSAAITELRQA